jgi:dienelactone hydrolase
MAQRQADSNGCGEASMKTEALEYKDGDVLCRGFLATPDGADRRAGIVVAHEAPGLDDHPKRRAQMLAELGYVALALDMYGGGKTVMGEETMKIMVPFRESAGLTRGRARAALDALGKHPRVDAGRLGAMGYCFGGLVVLELARSGAPLKGVVSFHGILETKAPARGGEVKAKMLICTGADDPLVPPEQVLGFQKEMTEAKVDWQVHTYGGAKHAFTNVNADKVGRAALGYNKSADDRSWEAMRDFWGEVLRQ